MHPHPFIIPLEGEDTVCTRLFPAPFRCIMCSVFVWLVPNSIFCLVVGILYVESLAAGTTDSLRSPSQPSAACGRFAPATGPSGLQGTKDRGVWGGILPLKMVGIVSDLRQTKSHSYHNVFALGRR